KEKQRKVKVWLEADNLVQPKFGTPVFYIPEWAMPVWAFPNDQNLPGLPLMANAEKVLALAQAAPQKFGLNHPPLAVTAELTKYVPGTRCGYLYHMQLPVSNNSSFTVYGKVYGKGKGERAYAIMRQIWESEACQRGDFILPQPYRYDPEMQIIWQEAFSGRPLAKIAETIPHFPQVVQEIGTRLAAFHNSRLQLPLEMTFDFQVEDMQQAIKAIGRAFPEHAQSCTAIGQKLLHAAARIGSGPLTPLHGSFKFSHIFATEKGIAFIDFDGANLGDPGFDLGRFLAHLYRMQAHGKIDPDLAEQTATNFCESYHRAACSAISQERINWFAASHLVTSEMYKAVKNMDTTMLSELFEIADRLCPS
ncbi:MAG: aminoglycoside phosphotransferase family protein, partial [candidate division KSB1 bacterium]|nr:aminoglycoside phosphotransferase family protein [candidate division KSB1 bacterium]